MKTHNQPWTHIKTRTDHVLLIGAGLPHWRYIGGPRLDSTKSHLRPRYGGSLSNQCVLGWKFYTFGPRFAAITGWSVCVSGRREIVGRRFVENVRGQIFKT